MRVFLNNNDGIFIDEYKFDLSEKKVIKMFLDYQRQRHNDENIDTHLLFFGSGVWQIPKEKFHEMYRKIVKGYSDLK